MSQEGRGCLVADQDGSDKVAKFEIEGRGPDPQLPIGSAHVIVHRVFGKKNGILRFINLFVVFFFFFFKNIYIVQCIETTIKFTTNVCNYIRPFCDII